MRFFLFLLFLTPGVANAQAPEPHAYVIRGVSVLPMTEAPTRLADVMVEDRRIVRIVAPGEAAPTPATVVIDGRGKFLVPGLIDAHVHVKEGDPLFLFVANGVTTVLNMAGRPFHLALRDSVARGLLLGPRIITAGPTTAQAGVESPEQAESLVAEQKRLGYDVIKMYGGRGGAMSRETYHRLLDAARRAEMRDVGHAPRNLPFQVVLEEGQSSIDHMEEIVYTHEPFARVLRPYVDVQFNRASDAVRDSLARLPVPDFATELRSEIDALAADVRRAGTAITPNIVFFRNIHWITTDSIHGLLQAPELAYATPAQRLNWSPFLNNYRNSWGDDRPLVSRYLGAATRLEEALTAAFHRAGVPIMAGTDSEFLGAQPGFGVHTELELFVGLGMTPMEALRTATVTPAQVMGIADSVGTIDTGRIADLVLLDADPAADIRNTRRIAGVFVAGRFVSREAFQAQLDGLARSYEPLQSTLAALMEALEGDGAEAALAVYESSARKAEIAKTVERVINTYGYRLLGEKRIEEAIRVFTLNTQAFPHEYNTWDSLGEAYMIAGDHELAVRYYRKVLELRSGDENATQMLKRLEVDLVDLADSAPPDTAAVRRELELAYEENRRAFLAEDVDAIMALRTEDFHTVAPDGAMRDRADMEQYTIGLLNGIERWIEITFDIDSLEVSGDLARAVVRQHLVRMALRPDGLVHHVETWATQNETWRRTADGWKLYRVDGVRDQRRLVDGQPE